MPLPPMATSGSPGYLPNFYPRSDGSMQFAATGVAPQNVMTFQFVESKESRSVGTSYEVLFNVILEPTRPELFTTYLDPSIYSVPVRVSDEFIIGWHTWFLAGWTFMDGALVKKWPPKVVRLENNHYKVTLTYAPYPVTNFTFAPTKTKKLFADNTVAFTWNSDTNDYTEHNLDTVNDASQVWKLLAIHQDTQGKAQGIDIVEPSFVWSERWTWGPYEYLNTRISSPSGPQDVNYFDYLTALVGSTNQNSFRGMLPDTVMFMGGTGRNTHPMTWEVDYNFSFKPKRTDYDFGLTKLHVSHPDLQGGHLYIDPVMPESGQEITLGGKKFVQQFPELVKIHRVAQVYNWVPMGLGDTASLGSLFFNVLPFIPTLLGSYTIPIARI